MTKMNACEKDTRDMQVREWMNRMAVLTESILATQCELAARLTPILRIIDSTNKVDVELNKTELVPLASDISLICDMAERAVIENNRLIAALEL